MATKKASAKKSTSSRTTAAKKTTKTTVKKPAAVKAVKATPVPVERKEVKNDKFSLPLDLPNIILAELVGTFILTLVALVAFSSPPLLMKLMGLGSLLVDPLFIGLTLAVIVMGIGAISGAHINPAVTFGFWAMGRLKTVMVPIYWISQVLGAFLAAGVVNVMARGNYAVNFTNFMQLDWALLFVELIGAAIFMFGIAAVVDRVELSSGAKALGVGLSLTIALTAGLSLLLMAQTADRQVYDDAKQEAQIKAAESKSNVVEEVEAGRSLYVTAPTLNPAVAVAVSESTTFTGSLGVPSKEVEGDDKSTPNRFGLEVILGTLVGAALGGNLWRLVSYRPKE